MKIVRFIRDVVHRLGNLLRGAKVAYYKLNGTKIGRHTMISLGAKLDVRRGQITIGDNCTVTYGCILVSHDATARRLCPTDNGTGRIVLEDDVYVGVGTIILRDVRIGRGAIIGAGAVITKDISPYAVVVGNPQQVIRMIR
jgi:acetyltransferase-like isoleucine patch superfamily enzyme